MAIRRSKFLLSVYPNPNYDRGYFRYYGDKKKKKLYIKGKKNLDSYNVVKPPPPSEYGKFQPPFYEQYLEQVKKESLKQVLSLSVTKTIDPLEAVFENESQMFAKLIQNTGMSQRELANSLGVTLHRVHSRLKAHKDKELSIIA